MFFFLLGYAVYTYDGRTLTFCSQCIRVAPKHLALIKIHFEVKMNTYFKCIYWKISKNCELVIYDFIFQMTIIIN